MARLDAFDTLPTATLELGTLPRRGLDPDGVVRDFMQKHDPRAAQRAEEAALSLAVASSSAAAFLQHARDLEESENGRNVPVLALGTFTEEVDEILRRGGRPYQVAVHLGRKSRACVRQGRLYRNVAEHKRAAEYMTKGAEIMVTAVEYYGQADNPHKEAEALSIAGNNYLKAATQWWLEGENDKASAALSEGLGLRERAGGLYTELGEDERIALLYFYSGKQLVKFWRESQDAKTKGIAERFLTEAVDKFGSLGDACPKEQALAQELLMEIA